MKVEQLQEKLIIFLAWHLRIHFGEDLQVLFGIDLELSEEFYKNIFRYGHMV